MITLSDFCFKIVFWIQVINVIIDLVASHLGFFAFTLCENNNPDRDPDMDCFLKHRLKFEDGSDLYMAPKKSGRQNLRIKLPGINFKQQLMSSFLM